MDESQIRDRFSSLVENAVARMLPGIVAELLPEVVRNVVFEGVGGRPLPKARRTATAALARAQSSLRAARAAEAPAPEAANGVKKGQRWRGKSYTGAKGRLIEIAVLGKDGITPKVLKTAKGRRPTAKVISYAQLARAYELVS